MHWSIGLAPMVRRVSVDNLKVYCEYATNVAFERSNREYFEGLIKGILVMIILSYLTAQSV
jgi:hypothetical protein